MQQMTVSKLIDALWALPDNDSQCPVYVWLDGVRYPVMYLDSIGDGCIDLAVGE